MENVYFSNMKSFQFNFYILLVFTAQYEDNFSSALTKLTNPSVKFE